MSKHRIVKDFRDAEVGRKSDVFLPKFFREWPSVESEYSLLPQPWKKLSRTVGTQGYPPFDIFNDWIMDFATISAGQLGRSDWHNYRRLILLHVPRCPFFCWYCFNDAWEECKSVTKGEVDTRKIINEFRIYRKRSFIKKGDECNILRLSGGEPFTQPELVADLASGFLKTFKDEDAFLWVDTNLYLISRSKSARLNEAIDKAIRSLRTLGNKSAIHACIHGANDDAFERNVGIRVSFVNILNGLKMLLEGGLNVYPRFNPIGFTPQETEQVFQALWQLDHNLPLRTYLGPVELLYDHAIDRMRAFQRLSSIRNKIVKILPVGMKGGIPAYLPPNGAIYRWNQLLELKYGIGYGKIPRHLEFVAPKIKPSKRSRRERGNNANTKYWENLVIVTKGWEKEVYAKKLLELVALPHGAQIEIEYENKWVEPTFLAHAYAVPGYYTNNPGISGLQGEQKVLFVAAIKSRPPKIVPIRWGYIKKLSTTDHTDERHSFIIKVEVKDYADDFPSRFQSFQSESLFESIARYVGFTRLPFGGPTGYFIQFVSLPLLPSEKDATGEKNDERAFKSIILNLTQLKYDKAAKDVYFRIKKIKRVSNTNGEVQLINGALSLDEGDSISIVFEACNPNLGNPGFPDVSEVAFEVISTEPDLSITPSKIRLSKYGEPEIKVNFPRTGELQGDLIIQQISKTPRIAEFRLPFHVKVKGLDTNE